MTINSGKRTRKDWLIDEHEDHLPEHADDIAERIVKKEDELIWAWYRDPVTDLTQTEARDRAQGPHGTDWDYGRFNISQSALSRKIKKLDDTMLIEPLHSHSVGTEGHEDNPDYDGGLIGTTDFEVRAKHNPASLDMLRRTLARFIVDMHAIDAFRNPAHKTPDWAQDRFPNRDPNMGIDEHNKAGWDDPALEPHEPHN